MARARLPVPLQSTILQSSILALALAGCGREMAAPVVSAPPPGVVLSVDGLELRAEEVAPLMADIASLYPEYALLHLRRLALTNEFLPRLAARAAAGAAWTNARDASASAGEDAAVLEQLADWHGEGTFHGLGVGLWSALRHRAPGVWSEPIELPGRFVRARLDQLVPAEDPREELLRLSLISFPYLAQEGEANPVDAAIDRSTLTLFDPDWAEAVPETWKHRMRGSKP